MFKYSPCRTTTTTMIMNTTTTHTPWPSHPTNACPFQIHSSRVRATMFPMDMSTSAGYLVHSSSLLWSPIQSVRTVILRFTVTMRRRLSAPLQIPFSPSQVQYQVHEYTNVSAVSSWPPEYNIPEAPPSSWTPSSPMTAELFLDPLYSSPSITDGCTNVFDLQFGDSLQPQDLGCSLSSSSVGSPEPCTPREVVRPTTTPKKPIRSRDVYPRKAPAGAQTEAPSFVFVWARM
ncbi:uncharacterized protein EV420DRAFT_1760920 [Desarmillaria tabescens]|uniref:Uncharacterized protein n=1 Tax=Armillaria tabescens TaxID=1929756 RepID=A0AA39TR55_ARMTA|nr:uncharacterized protein EV420DRAFT_1760920 [Desarmillaria tabescens]KAK0463648.1 hypothetical protein EV420DRAFT_1760920 [Desarmillaria tabescens]